MIHSVLHSPDGGEVVGTHPTLQEAHEWAKQGVLAAPSPERGSDTADTYVHRVHSTTGGAGDVVGTYQKRAHGTFDAAGRKVG